MESEHIFKVIEQILMESNTTPPIQIDDKRTKGYWEHIKDALYKLILPNTILGVFGVDDGVIIKLKSGFSVPSQKLMKAMPMLPNLHVFSGKHGGLEFKFNVPDESGMAEALKVRDAILQENL